MRRAKGPSYTPDAAKATDATIDVAERKDNARKLVRGEDVREAAKDALIRTAESRDERDTGSQLPSDVAGKARKIERAYRRAHGTRKGDTEASDDSISEDGPRVTEEAVTDVTERTPDEVNYSRDPGHGRRQADKPSPRQAARGDRPANGADGGAEPEFSIVKNQESESTLRQSSAHALSEGGMARRPKAQALRLGTDSQSPTSTLLTDGAPMAPTNVTPHAAMSRVSHMRSVEGLRRSASRQATQRAIVATAQTADLPAGMPIAKLGTTGATPAPMAEGLTALAPVAAVALVLLVIAIVAASILAGGAVDEDQKAGAHRLAQAAADECLACVDDGSYGHKGLKYSEYVRGAHGSKTDWDVCLVGWCLHQAGFVDAGLTDAYGDVASYVSHFRSDPELGEVHDWYGGDYEPVEGDLFVSWYADGTQHIGVVTGCDGTWFTTVEGDVAGGPDGLYDLDEEDGLGGYVAQRTRLLGEYSYTFIHPLYSEDAAAKARPDN